jgi:hypothetical protein
MTSIFLSHTSSDRDFARRLAEDLVTYGVRVWIDEAEIRVGDSLLEKVKVGIKEMTYLGVILSPAAVTSSWVNRELSIAIDEEISDNQIKILPILYKDCEIPIFVKGKVYADFRNEENYQGALELVLARLLDTPGGFPKAKILPLRFIPFDLGKFLSHNEMLKISRLATEAESKEQPQLSAFFEKVVILSYHSHLYYIFDDGIVVGVFHDADNIKNISSKGAVEFLIERRNSHLEILFNNHPFCDDIRYVRHYLNSSLPKANRERRVTSSPGWEYSGLSYVMSIHFVQVDYPYLHHEKFLSFLKGISEPSLSGIHDSPTLSINDESLRRAVPKLEAKLLEPADTALEPAETELVETINLVYEGNVYAYATWANVVFASSERRPDLVEICTRVEVAVQHAWLFFYGLSVEIEDQLRGRIRWSTKTLQKYEIYSEYLWNRVLSQSPVEDTQYHNILVGVVKTSQIEKVLHQLRTNFQLLRQMMKS